MATLTLRREKGAPLTHDEMDDNLVNLNNQTEELEDRVDEAIAEDGSLRDPKVVYGEDAGGTDAYAITVDGDFSTVDELKGVVIILVPNTTNTGAATGAINGFAAKDIKKHGNQLLESGDMVVGQHSVLVYNGTDLQLLNPRANSHINYSTDDGSADAYRITLANLTADSFQIPAALYAGYAVWFKASNTNTGASTLQVRVSSPAIDFTAIALKRSPTVDLVAGDVIVNKIYCAVYDGTRFLLQGGSRQVFVSTEYAVPAASGQVADVAHNLGGTPRMVRWVLRCKSSSLGYAVGDEVNVSVAVNNTGDARPSFIEYANATNVALGAFATAATQIPDKSAGTPFGSYATVVTGSGTWVLVCYAEL